MSLLYSLSTVSSVRFPKASFTISKIAFESAISDSAEEKNSLEKQRKENIATIDSNIISIYNKVMDARGGLAVVNVEGSGCGGCGAHIPPQKVTEVRAKSGIHRCDICGRFLFNQ